MLLVSFFLIETNKESGENHCVTASHPSQKSDLEIQEEVGIYFKKGLEPIKLDCISFQKSFVKNNLYTKCNNNHKYNQNVNFLLHLRLSLHLKLLLLHLQLLLHLMSCNITFGVVTSVQNVQVGPALRWLANVFLIYPKYMASESKICCCGSWFSF